MKRSPLAEDEQACLQIVEVEDLLLMDQQNRTSLSRLFSGMVSKQHAEHIHSLRSAEARVMMSSEASVSTRCCFIRLFQDVLNFLVWHQCGLLALSSWLDCTVHTCRHNATIMPHCSKHSKMLSGGTEDNPMKQHCCTRISQ